MILLSRDVRAKIMVYVCYNNNVYWGGDSDLGLFPLNLNAVVTGQQDIDGERPEG